MNLKNQAFDLIDKVKTYWKTPMKGRHMTFREIAAYSGGGIGAYMIITLGTACLLAANNVLLSSVLGVAPMDMYIMYVIAVLANVPLTGIRANIIDNTRNKAGKYRPYIVTMAVPTAIICTTMVWFPYTKLEDWFSGEIFGNSTAYVVKCAIIMILNLLLHFFYYFFYDAYENLIHVLSPNSQERVDVASIKSVVYSFAPSIVNLLTPIIAENVFDTNTTDIRVYRLLYPILSVLGILLCIIVYKYTEEKIVQAKTHVVRIRFLDALKAVAKNKYFWIISLAGWLGFLETSYGNILSWLYNYGGACSGNVNGLVVTIYGNAALWGMLFAPFCIRKWGKKAVLVVTNFLNVAFILAMLPFINEITDATIWFVLACLFMNHLMSSFGYILNPSIQADIRDYQQYKTGERIDGMFSAVATLGTVVTLVTSSVLPWIYKKGGLTEANAKLVTSNPSILNRVLGDGETVGEILAAQLKNGQNNYINSYSALYDLDVLLPLIKVLVIVAAVGAFLNVVPYFWYDFNEKKQKSVIRVLKVRAMFEDYANGVLNDRELVDTIDIIRNARINAKESPKTLDKKSYRTLKNKQERNLAKKAYKEAAQFNEEIEISKFVCAELDKFSNPLYKGQIENWQRVYSAGLSGLLEMSDSDIAAEIAAAKSMPRLTAEEKEARSAAIDLAKNKKSALSAIKKFYSQGEAFEKPDYSVLEGYYAAEDDCDRKIKSLYQQLSLEKKNRTDDASVIKGKISELEARKKELHALQKAEESVISNFARAAKPYIDAETNLKQMENYTRFDEIAAQYDDAKQRAEEAERLAEIAKGEQEREEKEYAARIKAEKKNKKKGD